MKMTVKNFINTDKNLSIIQDKAMPYFKDALPTHDWEHTMRVASLAYHIGNEENADMKILIAAALLHDIAREEADKNGTCHAELSAKMSEVILLDMEYSNSQRKDILHCISTHRFRGNNFPQTIEAKVLFDSDKLDAIGAIGVCRAYSYAGENRQALYSPMEQESKLTKTVNHSEHTPIVEFKVKLSKIKDSLYTETGRKIAEHRHKFMENFFNELLAEITGEK